MWQKYIKNFIETRDWEKFNTPKNISMALAVEASELLEIFQWLTEKDSFEIKNNPKQKQAIKEEIADILIDNLDISLVIARRKQLFGFLIAAKKVKVIEYIGDNIKISTQMSHHKNKWISPLLSEFMKYLLK